MTKGWVERKGCWGRDDRVKPGHWRRNRTGIRKLKRREKASLQKEKKQYTSNSQNILKFQPLHKTILFIIQRDG